MEGPRTKTELDIGLGLTDAPEQGAVSCLFVLLEGDIGGCEWGWWHVQWRLSGERRLRDSETAADSRRLLSGNFGFSFLACLGNGAGFGDSHDTCFHIQKGTESGQLSARSGSCWIPDRERAVACIRGQHP